VDPGDDARSIAVGQGPECRRQCKVEVQRQRVMDDEGVELRQLRREKLLDFRLQGGEFCGDLALVEGITHRAHLRMTRVQLRDYDELDAARVRERSAATAQDGDGMVARRQADGLL